MKTFFCLLIIPMMSLLCRSVSQAKTSDMKDLLVTIHQSYQEEIQKNYGLQLEIKFDQKQPYYFGGSSIENGTFNILVGSKVWTMKGMSLDAAAFLLCHEVGHLLGEAPKKTSRSWSSTEGQSDYFAARICLRKIFTAGKLPLKTKLNPSAKKLCSNNFKHRHEIILCSRIMTAGQSLMDSIYIFMNIPQMIRPDLLNPAPPLRAGETINYPTLQCRLDTIVAGALLQKSPHCLP